MSLFTRRRKQNREHKRLVLEAMNEVIQDLTTVNDNPWFLPHPWSSIPDGDGLCRDFSTKHTDMLLNMTRKERNAYLYGEWECTYDTEARNTTTCKHT